MGKKIIRHIIQDEPSSKDLFHGRGHERTAHSLSKAIVRFDDGDSAIGLEGSWGSGKSSVVEMAARKLAEKNGKGNKSFHFFTFDIWKSQGSDFRRSFLEHFLSWAKQAFPKKRSELEEIEAQIQGKTREIQTNNQPILDWYGIAVLVFLPFLPLYYFWAKKVFDDLSQAGKARDFLCSAPFLMLVAFVAATLALAWWKFKFGKSAGPREDFKGVISRLLLISSRQHQDHKVVQKVREIDPNDYEFHATFREILGVVQSHQDRVVVVLDNIDRLPSKEIKEYWALVRSIFARAHGDIDRRKNTEITAIVPYDRKLIEASVTEEEGDDARQSDLSSLDSRELFSKTFDEVLSVAPPVLSNAREFFADKLEAALPNQVSADDRFRAYRIFCELLNVEGGTTTPRSIVSFVNDLSSLYELHDGKFGLPTVAAYIAHQSRLKKSPRILNDENGLNQRIISLAGDEKLTRNLAAMVFNVEEDLAFQILLDDEIVTAAIAEDPETILELSLAPGFDLRVDDVVQAHIDEWRSTGDFGAAVGNISALLAIYNGDARGHLVNTMLGGFESVESISVKGEDYVAFLPIFSLPPETILPSIVSHFVDAALKSVQQQEKHTFQDGKNLADFLAATEEALIPLDGADALRVALGKQTLPKTPEYMFGLGSSIKNVGFDLNLFGSVDIEVPEDSKYFEEQFVRYPGLAIPALSQFISSDLLSDDELLRIANACLSALKEEEAKPENAGSLLSIVTMSWQNIEKQRRSEILLDDALAEGEFFKNVEQGETESSLVAQANLLFLAQEKLGITLPNPTKLAPNGSRTVDMSDAFEAFKTLLEGGGELEDSQVKMIAEKAITARSATHWIEFGKASREHKVVSQIVVEMFSCDTPPFINLKGLLSHFSYLEELLEDEALIEALRKYAVRVKESDITKLTLQDIPDGFIRAAHAVGDGQWDTLHAHVDALLHAIDQDAWSDHIEAMDHTTSILVEKVGSSGCKMEGGKFRKPFVNVIKRVLSGQSEIEADDGLLDTLLTALDPSYHEDVWRSLREEVSNVTATSLADAMQLCPELIANVAQRGERIMKAEKDNVLRHLLVPALEGRHERALQIFAGMGYTKLKDYQNAAQESTTDMVEGAWKSFSDADVDRDLTRNLSEALFGKRRAKSFLDPSYWIPFSK